MSHSVSIADVYSVDGINLSDSIEDDDNNDIEPELEELLSTLTPMQILLLDRGEDNPIIDSQESNDNEEVEEEAG